MGEPFKERINSENFGDLKSIKDDTGDSIRSTFRIRFFVALLLFVGFLWYDSGKIAIQGVDSSVIYQRIQDDQMRSIQELLDTFT